MVTDWWYVFIFDCLDHVEALSWWRESLQIATCLFMVGEWGCKLPTWLKRNKDRGGRFVAVGVTKPSFREGNARWGSSENISASIWVLSLVIYWFFFCSWEKQWLRYIKEKKALKADQREAIITFQCHAPKGLDMRTSWFVDARLCLGLLFKNVLM
jgi:hypothetical protein